MDTLDIRYALENVHRLSFEVSESLSMGESFTQAYRVGLTTPPRPPVGFLILHIRPSQLSLAPPSRHSLCAPNDLIKGIIFTFVNIHIKYEIILSLIMNIGLYYNLKGQSY